MPLSQAMTISQRNQQSTFNYLAIRAIRYVPHTEPISSILAPRAGQLLSIRIVHISKTTIRTNRTSGGATASAINSETRRITISERG
jgi:hypothetical protein